MAARAIWKGTLLLGRGGIPVKMYSAVEDRSVHFHLLERRSHERVKQHMVDPATGREVSREDIRKGVEIQPDTFVILSPEDLESIAPEPTRDIEVPHFLPVGRIPHQYYERPYYLGPDGDSRSYFALAEAMAHKEREGLARWVMRRRHYRGALRSRDGYLLLIALRSAEEVLSARELPAPPGKDPDQREIAMAEQLIGALSGEFRAEDYGDEYRERVLQYINAKAKGRKPKLEPIRASKETRSLADMLAASLKPATAAKRARTPARQEKRVA